MTANKKMTIMVSIPLKVECWKESNGTWMIYSKKFDISGYGKTRVRAMDMFQSQIEDILERSMSVMQRKYVKKNNK
jgi:hypothetical protein